MDQMEAYQCILYKMHEHKYIEGIADFWCIQVLLGDSDTFNCIIQSLMPSKVSLLLYVYPIKKIAVLQSENRRKSLCRVVKSQCNRRL